MSTEKESTWQIIPMSALCCLDFAVSNINGKYIDMDDFVRKYDHSPETAEPYGCGNMKADVKQVTQKVLDKYEISKGDYYIIAHEISEAVSFGRCGWCI